MHTEAGHLYYVYNQGNNKEVLFIDPSDYLCFMDLMERYLSPICEILAWCLMPNNFHFCIQATEASVGETLSGKFLIQAFSRGVGNLLSAYAAVANHKQSKTGARFKPRTKLKLLTGSEDGRYDTEIIRYIHYNPTEVGLVTSPEDWPYSSAMDYAGLRDNGLCNLELAKKLGLLCP